MAQRVGQGGQATVEATFRDGAGALVDPVGPTVSITDAVAGVFAANDVPVRQSLGIYTYAFTVPADGVLGNWDVRWRGVVNGNPIIKDETVEVVAAGEITVGTPDEPPAPRTTLVSVPDLIAYMSDIKLEAAQHQAAEYVLEGVEGEVESYLNRPIASGQHTETTYATYDGFVRLGVTPINSIESVSILDQLVPVESYRVVPGGFRLSMPYVGGPGLFITLGELSMAGMTPGSTEQTGIPIIVTYTGGLPADAARQVRLEILRIAAAEMQNHHDDTLSSAGQERGRAGSRPTVLPYGLDDNSRKRLSRFRRRVAV